MKDEMINKLLEKSIKYLDTAEAFTVKEVPIYVKELLEFKFFEHALWATIPSVVIALAVLLGGGLLAYSFVGEYGDEKEGARISGSITLFLTLLFGAISASETIIPNAVDAYKAKQAPRVYLIEYARGK